MSAIKGFFTRAKATRAYETKLSKVVPIEETQKVIVDPFQAEIDYFHSTLVRDWWMEYDALIGFIKLASPYVYKYLEDHITDYSDEVQKAICDVKTYSIPRVSPKYTVVDLTVKNMYDIEEKHNLQEMELFNSMWEAYKTKHGLQCPARQEEEDLDILYLKLKEQKKRLADYLSRTQNSYVPPSRRTADPQKMDPVATGITKNIMSIESDTKDLQMKVIELNKIWEEDQKNEFAKQYYKM